MTQFLGVGEQTLNNWEIGASLVSFQIIAIGLLSAKDDGWGEGMFCDGGEGRSAYLWYYLHVLKCQMNPSDSHTRANEPVSISAELAKAVAPGVLHGVDMDEAQIDMARQIAAYRARDNALFHVGDITDLPFEDGYFDVLTPMTSPSRFTRGPPLLPGLMTASVWITSTESCTRREEMTPVVTV